MFAKAMAVVMEARTPTFGATWFLLVVFTWLRPTWFETHFGLMGGLWIWEEMCTLLLGANEWGLPPLTQLRCVTWKGFRWEGGRVGLVCRVCIGSLQRNWWVRMLHQSHLEFVECFEQFESTRHYNEVVLSWCPSQIAQQRWGDAYGFSFRIAGWGRKIK